MSREVGLPITGWVGCRIRGSSRERRDCKSFELTQLFA